MYEGNPYFGADFSSLGEAPPPPPEKTPEKLEANDDDDEDEAKENPKTLLEILRDEPEETEEDPKKAETEAEEPEEDQETEEDEPEVDAELEPDSKEMTGEEEQLVTIEALKAREEPIEAERTQAATPEAAKEADAVHALVEQAKQAIEENGDPVDVALDKGEAAALEVLGVEKPEIPEQPKTETVSTEPEIAEIPEPEPVTPTVPAGATPPVPPTGPPGMGPTGPAPAGRNILPPTPNIAPAPAEDRTDRRVSTGGAVLAGGLVGYLLGRRRGRIKTEKKLLPIQHKLEKEIADLHGKIAWREASIRSLARERVAKNPEDPRQAVERLQTQHERKRGDAETTAAEKLHTQRPEKLGKFAMGAERPSLSEAFRAPERLKPVDAMALPELLAIGERIRVEQSTVKRLFETNRLNTEGLRRVIRAYLRGERYDQVITANLLSPENYAYAETLQRNVVPDSQLQGGGLEQPATPTPGQAPNMVDPRSNPAFQQAYNMPEPETSKKNSQTGVIVAGVVVAVIILIFMLTR